MTVSIKPVAIATAPTVANIGPTASPPVRLLLAMAAVEGFTGKGMMLRPAIENAAALHRVSALELSLLLAQKQRACAVARTELATKPVKGDDKGEEQVP